tara:strand:+ start:698 stop:1177 length:480 start_codon:yes stop_codon:yes gene_type:complete
MKIKNNFLERTYFDSLQKNLLSNEFPWLYQDSVAKPAENNYNHFYFTHTFYEDLAPKSNYFQNIIPILQQLKVKSLIRVRAIMYVNQGDLVVHDKHTDFPFTHNAAVLYVNDNDGYTEIDNKKIESVANTVSIFDGSKEHNSTTCTDQKVRVVLSVNYF